MCQVDVSQTKYEVLVKTNLKNMDKIIQYSISIAVFCLQNSIRLLVIFADQVFIDPSFLGIFVYGPLQSFVVNGGSLNKDGRKKRRAKRLSTRTPWIPDFWSVMDYSLCQWNYKCILDSTQL